MAWWRGLVEARRCSKLGKSCPSSTGPSRIWKIPTITDQALGSVVIVTWWLGGYMLGIAVNTGYTFFPPTFTMCSGAPGKI